MNGLREFLQHRQQKINQNNFLISNQNLFVKNFSDNFQLTKKNVVFLQIIFDYFELPTHYFEFSRESRVKTVGNSTEPHPCPNDTIPCNIVVRRISAPRPQ
jgi:hypothetical protein